MEGNRNRNRRKYYYSVCVIFNLASLKMIFVFSIHTKNIMFALSDVIWWLWCDCVLWPAWIQHEDIKSSFMWSSTFPVYWSDHREDKSAIQSYIFSHDTIVNLVSIASEEREHFIPILAHFISLLALPTIQSWSYICIFIHIY